MPASVDGFRGSLVVRSAKKPDSRRFGSASEGDRVLVIELQEASLFAPATVGSDEGASNAVALRNLAARLTRDEPVSSGARHLARPFGLLELLSLEALDEGFDRGIEDGFQIATRVPMPHEIPSQLERIAKRAADGHMEREAMRRERLDSSALPLR